MPVSANCKIELAEGINGRIKNWTWEGNEIGCDGFMRAIEKEEKQRQKASEVPHTAG